MEKQPNKLPPLNIHRVNRVHIPTARLTPDLVKRAYRLMNKRNWTVTMFIEKAWTLLIETEEKKGSENAQ